MFARPRKARPTGGVTGGGSWRPGNSARRRTVRGCDRPRAARSILRGRGPLNLVPLSRCSVIPVAANEAGRPLVWAEEQPAVLSAQSLQRRRILHREDPLVGRLSLELGRARVLRPTTSFARTRAFLAEEGADPIRHRVDRVPGGRVDAVSDRKRARHQRGTDETLRNGASRLPF